MLLAHQFATCFLVVKPDRDFNRHTSSRFLLECFDNIPWGIKIRHMGRKKKENKKRNAHWPDDFGSDIEVAMLSRPTGSFASAITACE